MQQTPFPINIYIFLKNLTTQSKLNTKLKFLLLSEVYFNDESVKVSSNRLIKSSIL